MTSIIEKINWLIGQEAWCPFFRKKRKNPLNMRDFMWRAIRLYATRASMPSWGLPFEAIAASALLKDRDKKRSRKQRKVTEDDV